MQATPLGCWPTTCRHPAGGAHVRGAAPPIGANSRASCEGNIHLISAQRAAMMRTCMRCRAASDSGRRRRLHMRRPGPNATWPAASPHGETAPSNPWHLTVVTEQDGEPSMHIPGTSWQGVGGEGGAAVSRGRRLREKGSGKDCALGRGRWHRCGHGRWHRCAPPSKAGRRGE